MKTNKYKGMSKTRLNEQLLIDGIKSRPEIINELERQELAREARSKYSYFIQWIILILTIIVVVFTIYSFTKETTPNIVTKKREGIGSTNTSSIQGNKQNDTQKDIKNNKADIHKNIHNK
ncbi:MAG: hypothetical protein ACUZ8N_06665 [Candidatus Scalindua sp.]